MFLESYWNSGSVKAQGRWFDNFVISKKLIGPVKCPANPRIYKTPYYGPGEIAAWDIEIASDYDGNDVVYKSHVSSDKENITVKQNNGNFLGSLEGETMLLSGKTYFCRVRQKSSNGEWSNWSRWHQGFIVE